jgi:hypothetical protein
MWPTASFLTIACNTRLVKRDQVPASSAVGSTPNRFADPLIDPAIAQGRADRLNRCGRVVSQKTNGAQSGLK